MEDESHICIICNFWYFQMIQYKESGDGLFWMNNTYHNNHFFLENGETHRAAGRVETAHI